MISNPFVDQMNPEGHSSVLFLIAALRWIERQQRIGK